MLTSQVKFLADKDGQTDRHTHTQTDGQADRHR